MSTRSLTVFMDDDREVAVLYRQCDGYPKGHGAELADILKGMSVSNGISFAGKVPKRAPYNGMGDLAVRVIASLKRLGTSDTGADWPGNFYLYPAGTRDAGEEYLYTVSVRDDRPYIRIQDVDDKETRQMFEGTPEKVATWIKRQKA